MSRINEDDIIIGGDDSVDDMERAGRLLAETAQLIDEIPTIEEDGEEVEDLSAEITIGGGDDNGEYNEYAEDNWFDYDDVERADDEEYDSDEDADQPFAEITIGGGDELSYDDFFSGSTDDDSIDWAEDEPFDTGDEAEDNLPDRSADEDDKDSSDQIHRAGQSAPAAPTDKRERSLRPKKSGAAKAEAKGGPVPLIAPRDLTAVREKKAKEKKKAENDSFFGDDDFRREYLVTASPHLHCGETTRGIMQDVIISLMPAALVSIVYFGWRAALTLIVCIASCVLSEYISRRVMKRPQTIGDYSAVVTGVLLAFSLPPEINPLFAAIGGVVAIVAVKQMFGGIGMNFANPAITARIVLMLSFPVAMTTWTRPFSYLGEYYDAVSTATPMAALSDSATEAVTLRELFFGFHQGCLGEVCAVALLIGGAYLLIRGIITWHIPVSFIAVVMLFALIAGENPLYHVLSGGVMLGAFFMATDYVTSPSTKWGKIIFGAGCGFFTMLIRLYGSMAEGVSFAILLMNILTPHIERLTALRPYGEERDLT